MNFELSQRQKQKQLQVMSQRQVLSLEFLALGAEDLREKILQVANENPAIILEEKNLRTQKKIWSSTKIGKASAAAELASENFQAVLESCADTRKTLHSHLLSQLNMIRLSELEFRLAQKIIYNLDERGFYINAPEQLLAKNDSPELLKKCISIVRQLDPTGICVANVQESLLIQAKMKNNAPPLAFFFLEGHLDFLDPPKIERIEKKIMEFQKMQQKLFAKTGNQTGIPKKIEECEIEKAIKFIKTLDPFPARNFCTQETKFIAPDIFVEKINGEFLQDDFSRGIVCDGKNCWKIFTNDTELPKINLNRTLLSIQQKNEKISAEVRKAQDLIGILEFRQSTVLRATCVIVKKQAEFFRKGPGFRTPLRQQDVADALSLHETTISRMANSKFLQCEWGLFEMKYFFTNATNQNGVSKDNVLRELKSIFSQNDAKYLSDQRISELLFERGIKVARRTIAKYRVELNINSSYNR